MTGRSETCDSRAMPLSAQDIEALRLLIREEVEAIVAPRFESVDRRFDQVDQNFDALFKANETREQENLVIKHQLAELEKKVA